jgi:heme exporter protein B
MSGIAAALVAIVRRDLALALRRASDTVAVITFFVLAIVLFPLGVGPDLAVLARIAAGTIWVAALLAAMLSLEWCSPSARPTGSPPGCR